MASSTVTVELLGVPRLRGGLSCVSVTATTAREALREVASRCPKLGDLVGAEGGLAPQYLLSLDGRLFLKDLSHRLAPGDRLVLLSADAGG